MSICSTFRAIVPQWRHSDKNFRFWVLLHSKRNLSYKYYPISSSFNDDSVSSPKPNQLRYDLSEDLFGLAADLQPRKNVDSGAPTLRSWFGPNGQYIREFPCPSCRGRGYTPCTECGIERPRLDCSECNGKGLKTCHQCFGDCVIWEESIDERPWERARSISPVKVKEDDEVDGLEIKLAERRKSKRAYGSVPPQVKLKISKTLKSLNARTGLFSKRMKIIHSDPTLRTKRSAAIKRSKGAPEARKRASESMKAFFLDPENRRKRSISMKGVRFYCSNCGREGHRRHYCPELLQDNSIERGSRCRLCGQKGHNRRTCQKSKLDHPGSKISTQHSCKICGQIGHNRRSCRRKTGKDMGASATRNGLIGSTTRTYSCKLCLEKGHNVRTCPRNKTPDD